MNEAILTLKIKDLSRGGSGVAREESGRVIFVPLTAPGDEVRVRVVEENKHFAQAELVEIVQPSEIRQTPPCSYFGRCGGCQWQHLPYEFQWKTKVGGVRQAMSRAGITEIPAFEELPAERIWEYRNRIQLRGTQDQIGFYARGSNQIVAIERCEIARPEINQELPALRKKGSELAKDFKVEVEVLPDGSVREVWNQGHAALGFRQVHDEQNDKLKSWVRGALTPGNAVLDLFGGSGNLSLGLTELFPKIDCVDVGAPAGVHPEFKNLTFHRSAVVPWLFKRTTKSQLPVSAILDPPREGLGSDFDKIAVSLDKIGVKELVAVGCDVDSWIRDVRRFIKRGWTLKRVGILDFFPQTPHVESLALLIRR